MKLTIITINFNNASGLKKTMESVLAQTSDDFEYIVVDGGSTDSSCKVIIDKCLLINGETGFNGIQVTCISEPDTGIYNAMNKGIRMAKGEYCQFLNSGDCLVAKDVTEKMLKALPDNCNIFYGNMLKQMPKGTIRRDTCEECNITMLTFYKGSLNHSPALIKHSLFDQYGLYDETLKIVSDWKWYLNVIGIHNEPVQYINMDITLFDMTGISSVNSELDKQERRKVLQELLPASVVIDYERWAFSIDQQKRINRYWITRNGFWLIERVLFKCEK